MMFKFCGIQDGGRIKTETRTIFDGRPTLQLPTNTHTHTHTHFVRLSDNKLQKPLQNAQTTAE